MASKAAGESKPEAYPLGYVEDFDESRTKLAGFFSILLERLDASTTSKVGFRLRSAGMATPNGRKHEEELDT
jgi:hypothetical protein